MILYNRAIIRKRPYPYNSIVISVQQPADAGFFTVASLWANEAESH